MISSSFSKPNENHQQQTLLSMKEIIDEFIEDSDNNYVKEIKNQLLKAEGLEDVEFEENINVRETCSLGLNKQKQNKTQTEQYFKPKDLNTSINSYLSEE
ncbi:hypothetical protein ABK040_003366 [Willaertia magna]